ncbi:Arginine ABC transporter [Klebsiella pneumoniae]|uniref:Arginine ABC transporter n=1 Tax=Klebsiella pneumoniae TaxID=573 RepID=A0A2X3EU59_KLEPN|nr:Arginine ABC transporter [Klebsiella pneumoniae]
MKKLVLAALLTSFAFGAAAAEKSALASPQPIRRLNRWTQITRLSLDIDLAHALCKQMQAECTFTNHAFDSLIPALKFKKYDAVISGMDITPERSKQVAFTDPYYATRRW